MPAATHLYRHFAKDGALLYVGVSLSALQRLAQHRTNAHWFERIRRVEVDTFSTRKEALDAERAAIINEKPLFNIQFSEREAAARVQRNETIKAKPSKADESVKRDRQEIEAAFWQCRERRREKQRCD